jgi:hypothetical protein
MERLSTGNMPADGVPVILYQGCTVSTDAEDASGSLIYRKARTRSNSRPARIGTAMFIPIINDEIPDRFPVRTANSHV